MAARVVDELEVVEVEEEHGDRLVVARLARERVLDAVVEERTVGELGERVVEGAVAELLLEGAPVVHVARGEHDAAEAGIVEQVRGDRLHVAPAAVRVRDAPLRLERLADRAGRDTGEEGAECAHVVGMGALEQAGADGLPPARAEHRLDRAGQRADRAVALEDRDEVGGVLDDRLQARLALPGDPVQLERGVDAPAPLPREDGEQGREREHGGHRERLVAAGRGREQPDRGEQRVDEVDPAEGDELGPHLDAQPDAQADGGHAEVDEELRGERGQQDEALHGEGTGQPDGGEQQGRGDAEPRIGEREDGPLRRAPAGDDARHADEHVRGRHQQRHQGRRQEQQHRHEHELHGPRAAGADVELDQQDGAAQPDEPGGPRRVERLAAGQEHGHGEGGREEQRAQRRLRPQLPACVQGRAPPLVHQRGGEVVVPSAGRRRRAPEAAHRR